MPLHGEDLTRPTYEALRTLQGGNINLTIGVWKHKILGVEVVQKTIDMAGRQDAAAYKEPRLLHAIRHDHIVPVHEAQFDPEIPNAITFIMPVYSGGSVEKALLADYRFSLDQARRLAVHALSALGHVHREHRYVHRDVKPGNLLMDGGRENAFLSDFGSAAEMDAAGIVDALEMTPFYQAPEAEPQQRIDARADLYSVAVTLFEMLSGRFSYENTTFDTVQKRLAAGRRAMPDSWLTFAPHVPGRLRRVVRKGLERDPNRRWQTAREFSRALEKVDLIDWNHEQGDDLDGVWVGSWPPHEREDRRAHYNVTSELIRGPKRRLTAYQRLPGAGWRQFGVARRSVPTDDRKAVEEIFADVSAKAAQLRPAR
jgi:serine/threonine protein kinase